MQSTIYLEGAPACVWAFIPVEDLERIAAILPDDPARALCELAKLIDSATGANVPLAKMAAIAARLGDRTEASTGTPSD